MLARPLFNVCLDTVVRQLLRKLQKLGLTIRYKMDGQLMHCKNLIEEALMWILLYANDNFSVCDTLRSLGKLPHVCLGAYYQYKNIPKCWLSLSV